MDFQLASILNKAEMSSNQQFLLNMKYSYDRGS